MRLLYDLYQKYQKFQHKAENGLNVTEDGKVTKARPVTPKKRRNAIVSEDPLSLSELYAHPDIKPLKDGWVPIGITKHGELIQSTWEGMTTGGITGNRNWGKSGILKALTLHALRAKTQGFNCQLSIFDPHHNLPNALGTFFTPILHQFNQEFLGHDPLEEGTYLPFFESLESQARQAQKTGFDETTPWNIIVIDETDVLLKSHYGKKAYKLIVSLINLRKARIFFLLSFADTTKEGSGGHGTGIISASSTVFCVRYNVDKARRILSGPGEAAKTANLRLGWAVVKVPPRNPGEEARVQIVKMPLVTKKDLDEFT